MHVSRAYTSAYTLCFNMEFIGIYDFHSILLYFSKSIYINIKGNNNISSILILLIN